MAVYKHSTYTNDPKNNQNEPKWPKIYYTVQISTKAFYLVSNDLVDDDD